MILYFALVFVVTWGLWFAAESLTTPAVRTILFYLGVFTPGIVALGMTHWKQGSPGLRALLARLVKADVGARWFVFALFFIASLKLLVALIVRVSTGAWPIFGTQPVVFMFAGAVFSTLSGGQAGEELGWRGYALPRLARNMGLGPACLMLGGIWATWHLPLFFITNAETVGQSFPFYLLQVTGLSVAIGWLYMKTNGSLLATMLFHAAVNNTKDIVPSALPAAGNPWTLHATTVGWWTLTVLWLCAAWFLLDMWRDRSVAQLSAA